ncbi:MAG: bifunctional sulfate adenylyltransferase/adenylylsulfate kinase [Acidobacteriota bacterium]
MPNPNKPPVRPLVNLVIEAHEAGELKRQSSEWPSWSLTPRQFCDLELLMNGAFSPLTGFMNQNDYESVCKDMRLSGGVLWPIPITLDIPAALAETLEAGSRLALRDFEGVVLAVLDVETIWKPNREREAALVYGTANPEHPGVAYLLNETHPVYVGGRIRALQLPTHYDFLDLRLSPSELRERFMALGWSRIVAFQTRNPLHRAHQELTLRASKKLGAHLLIHPVVGMTKPGDVDHYTRVRCYQAILNHYPKDRALLSLLPLAMRMGGPRETVLHAIIRKNYGCSHLIVGRDHAGPGSDSNGDPFYGPYEAQELLAAHQKELGIDMVPFKMMVYEPQSKRYVAVDEVPRDTKTLALSGSKLRELLALGKPIPEWFSFPDVIEELRRTYPPRHRQGFTIFFTGLPSSGKSTVANTVMIRLLEAGGRPVTLLDGDLVRRHLSSELGFSKEHRDINIRRIGWVASEITKNAGIAICAPIAPYESLRREVRKLIEPLGGFILVHIATPLEVCEKRDRKGMYAKARAGIIKEFTGISDPYEEPAEAEIRIDTSGKTPGECAESIIQYLVEHGYIKKIKSGRDHRADAKAPR